jgi:transcriptional regulator with XRE-family HTH domain
MTNTLKLKALMVEKGFTQEQLAKKLGISEQSLNYKINNKREFKASEIQALTKILDVQDVDSIFFARDVDL